MDTTPPVAGQPMDGGARVKVTTPGRGAWQLLAAGSFGSRLSALQLQ